MPSREWLEADGRGGYASGTADGERTRRYHALLLVATTPPTGRMVLVNGIDAWLDGAPNVWLTHQRYLPDIVTPADTAPVASFTHTPWPRWTHDVPGGTLTYEVFVDPDGGDTVLRWHGPAGTRLNVRPLLSGRDQNALHTRNPAFRFDARVQGGNVCWRPYDGVPAVAALTNGAYAHAPEWYNDFLYTVERDRGYDDHEDLASPGLFRFVLDDDRPAVMILRAGDGLNVRAAAYAKFLAASEWLRRTVAEPGPEGMASCSYLVDRGTGRTAIAGFPWFTDWGRDSFIALRGLAIATGRLEEAGAILAQWAGLVNDGMLPNRFPDTGDTPEYNAVDASLWFVIAVHDYLDAARPGQDIEQRLATAVQAILDGYRHGTRFAIRMDADGLIAAGVPGVQLTWMDAKYGDLVVTPRIGKPVEVQALWINALRIATRWSDRWAALATLATASFAARFPAPAGGLFDVVDVDHVAGRNDPSVRPNQIFAVGGLPHALLDGPPARGVVDLMEAKLLTPLGLRTLSPDDPAYRGLYRGNLHDRDTAYHQGTAWPWLAGPFVQAWLRVHGDTPPNRAHAAARFLAPLEAHLQEYGLGHVSEVADGDPPHRPGGCPFQAWSLGELIRMRAMLA